MQDFDEKSTNMHMGRLIQMLSHQMKRKNCIVTMIDGDGLTVMQKHILKFILLETLHREIYQKDIEEEFQIRKSAVIPNFFTGKNGFIYRENVEKDARLKRIIPTKKAEALRPSILSHINESEAQMTQGISEKDVAVCKQVLLQMLQNLSENKL